MASSFKIVYDLCLFGAAHSDERLQLNDHTIEADEIGAISSIERPTLVCERKLYFLDKGNISICKLDGQGFLVNWL